jgi:hypothetical protein
MEKRGKKPGARKTGGRAKGVPNKKTAAFREVLIEKKFCIPSEAIKLLSHPDATVEIQLKILEFLAAYSMPKIAPMMIEVTPEDFTDVDPIEAEVILAQH